MRKRNRKKLKIHNLIIALAFILPFAPVLLYLQGATTILDDVTEFNYYIGVDTSDFIDPNFDTMAKWADILDERFEEIHMPTGIALRCTFKEIFGDDIEYYQDVVMVLNIRTKASTTTSSTTTTTTTTVTASSTSSTTSSTTSTSSSTTSTTSTTTTTV